MSDPKTGQISEIKLRDAKADMVLAENSGYDPETFVNIPWTNDLRAFRDINTMRTNLSETEAGNILRLKSLEEEKEAKQQKVQDSLDDAIQSAQDQKEWEQSTHNVEGFELSGKQLKHMAGYAKENKDRLIDDVLERNPGMSRRDATIQIEAIGYMDGPPTQNEQKVIDEAKAQGSFKDTLQFVGEESGIPPEAFAPKADIASPPSVERAHVPLPEPSI